MIFEQIIIKIKYFAIKCIKTTTLLFFFLLLVFLFSGFLSFFLSATKPDHKSHIQDIHIFFCAHVYAYNIHPGT